MIPNTTSSDDRNRAVSDILAFTFVFAIIITSTALVYGVGFGSLTDLRDSEQTRNAEFAFEALGNSIDDIAESHTPGRSGEVSLSGGQLVVRNDATIDSVTVGGKTYDSGGSGYAVGSLDYSYEDTIVSYHGGTVFRSDRGNSAALTEPPFSCDPDRGRATVSIVTLVSSENGIGADGSVQIVAREAAAGLIYPNATRSAWVPANASNPEVTIEMSGSKHNEAWARAMEEQGWNSNADGTEFTCDLPDGGTVYVRQTIIDIVFRT